jgi:hypothetical protein
MYVRLHTLPVMNNRYLAASCPVYCAYQVHSVVLCLLICHNFTLFNMLTSIL